MGDLEQSKEGMNFNMKKVLIYFVSFIFICFILPSICTKTLKLDNSDTIDKQNIEPTESNAKTDEEQNQTDLNGQDKNQTASTYDYKQYNTIKLLHTASGEIEELPLDEYLYGVVSAEMPASYEIEALKAQATVARTYLMYQIQNSKEKHENANICDSYACCQAWISKEERFSKWEEAERESNWQKITQAVNETAGKIITYENQPINAFFHSNSGGVTESSVNIWGGIEYPYLKSVETSGEDGYLQYSSEVSFSREELINKIKETHSDIQIDWNSENAIQIQEYTNSGRVRTIKFGNISIAGTEARTILGLKSTNFTINYQDDKIIFSVKGYGHGVGMSQTGADSLAKQGSGYEEIIKHFYTGVEITSY